VRYDLPVGHKDFGKLFPCPGNHAPVDSGRKDTLRRLGNLDAFTDKTFEAFQTERPGLTQQQRASLDMAAGSAWGFAQAPRGWLILEGSYGCGKTHLAAAIANWRLEQGDSVVFMTTPDLLDYLRSAYAPNAEAGYDETFEPLRQTALLVLDDLGTENPSQWAQEKLFQLLNHRYNETLPTVITTNVEPDALDPRLRSRLMDERIVQRIRINAPDFRSGEQQPAEHQLLSTLSLLRDMTFESFDTRNRVSPEEQHNLERALRVAASYAEAPQGMWLMLVGEYGTGKTHLAAAIGNYWESLTYDVLFVTVPDLLDYLRRAFDPAASLGFGKLFTLVRNTPYLILDDLGTENATAWAREKLFQIMDYRYIAQLPTVITSGKNMEQLDRRIHTRLLDSRRCSRFALTAEPYVLRMKRNPR
jgi:DNA replication protein DnaC